MNLAFITFNLLSMPILDIGIMGRVFANGLGDLSSIPGRVIPKDSKNGTLSLLA